MVPTNAPLVGFGVTRVYPIGAVTLPIIVGDYPQQITEDIAFLVIDYLSTYNAGLPYPQFMEGRNFNLPPDNQVLNQVRSRRGAWKPSGCAQVLHSHAGDGLSFTNYEYRRTVDGVRVR